MVADLQIEAEEANGGVLLTVVDSARLTMLLTRETAAELLDAIDACMKTGERQTTRAVDVWRAAPDLPVFGVHVSIDGASWTCGAVRGWTRPRESTTGASRTRAATSNPPSTRATRPGPSNGPGASARGARPTVRSGAATAC